MIDFHVHSYVSDGTNSPREIINMAYDKKIKAIALTDHDSIEGINEAQGEADRLNIDFLQGIEISTSYGYGRLLHILGIGIDTKNDYFLKAYKKMKISRENGMERVLYILKQKGITIDIKELRKYAVGEYLDRQAIPKYFVDKKLCDGVPKVWQNYLDPIPYGDGELLDLEETFNIIKNSGGLSFLAHFNKKIGLEGFNSFEKEQKIKHLVDLGLDGIERYYPSYSNKEIQYVDYLIGKYNLIPSGGTDFHGKNRPEVTLGGVENGFFVPDSIYENISMSLKKLKEI